MCLPPTCLWPGKNHFLSLKIHYDSCLTPLHIQLPLLQALTLNICNYPPRNLLQVFPQPPSAPALSGRGSRPCGRTSGRGRSHENIPDVASWVVPHSEGRPAIIAEDPIEVAYSVTVDISTYITSAVKSSAPKQGKSLL